MQETKPQRLGSKMAGRVLITGGAGLVGSECAKFFSQMGWRVITVDNYMRGKIFGKDGDTTIVIKHLVKEYNIEHYEMDVRDNRILQLLKDVDAVVHTAAQPSHPKSIEIPIEYFSINAYGTLLLRIFIFSRVTYDVPSGGIVAWLGEYSKYLTTKFRHEVDVVCPKLPKIS